MVDESINSYNNQFLSLINSMNDGVITVDHLLRIKIYNAAALNILDVNTIKPAERLNKLLDLVDINNQPVDIINLIEQVTKQVVYNKYQIKYIDGSYANLYLAISPIYSPSSTSSQETAKWVITLRDITKQKSLEQEKDEFISVVSHELRTPIAISEGNISNAMYILNKTDDKKVISDSLNEAHKQVLFLADMINDLSTLSRAERGKLEINLEKINVHDLITELRDNYQDQVKAKGLRLKLIIDPNLNIIIQSRLYLKEILQNLITNSIKYTERGTITISAKQLTESVQFQVSDTGIGISKSDQAKVFDRFFRSEDYRTRQNSGTGLGLYVTLKLVKIIKGQISLSSKLNHGTTFSLLAPSLKLS